MLEPLQRLLVVNIKVIVRKLLNYQVFELLREKLQVTIPSLSFKCKQTAPCQCQPLLCQDSLLIAITKTIIMKAINFTHIRQVNHLLEYFIALFSNYEIFILLCPLLACLNRILKAYLFHLHYLIMGN